MTQQPLGLPLIDTHAHLLDKRFDDDRAQTIARAHSSGVGAIIEISDTLDAWGTASTFAEEHPSVHLSLGEHPHYADLYADGGRAQKFKELFFSHITNKKVVAIGEIGLDFYKNYASENNQILAFSAQLAVWRESGKPLVIHCRKAEKKLAEVILPFLPQAKKNIGVIHCFSGSLEFALSMIKHGFKLGVDGPLTYNGNEALVNVIKTVGLEHIVLETDSPYLSPAQQRGRRNEPAFVLYVAEELARIYNIPRGEVDAITTSNARELFGI